MFGENCCSFVLWRAIEYLLPTMARKYAFGPQISTTRAYLPQVESFPSAFLGFCKWREGRCSTSRIVTFSELVSVSREEWRNRVGDAYLYWTDAFAALGKGCTLMRNTPKAHLIILAYSCAAAVDLVYDLQNFLQDIPEVLNALLEGSCVHSTTCSLG